MADTSHKCSSCGTIMELGALIDHNHGTSLVQQFGKLSQFPKKSLNREAFGFNNFQQIRRTKAYHCPNCHQIQIFADEKILVESSKKQSLYFFVIFFFIMISLAIGYNVLFVMGIL